MASKIPHQPQVKPIHFFKIITDHSLHEGKLMIPNAFVKTYGEELSSTIFLHPPNGTEWKLNLEKHDGKIWFQKGWKEFAEHHSLAYGHLLVITYERTSHFHVHIFDKSTLEIDYPIEGKMASNEGKKSPNNPNLEHYGSSQNRKDNSPLEFPQPCKMRSNKFDKVETISKLSKATLHHTDTKCEEKTVITAKYVTALDRASSFKPRNPSFLVVMQPSYIGKHSRGLLNIPSMFCKKHFDLDKEHGDIDLLVLNVGVWPVRYKKRIIHTRKRFELTSGWKTFAKDNNFQLGDVCTFELIFRTKLTFHVHIFREIHNSNSPSSQESGQLRPTCLGLRKKMKSFTTTKSSSPKNFSSFV